MARGNFYRRDRGFPDAPYPTLWPVFTGDPLERMLHQFAGILQGKFFLNVCLVRLDGFDADMQVLRNLARGTTLANETEHGEFAIGQRLHGRLVRCRAADNLAQETPGNPVADI